MKAKKFSIPMVSGLFAIKESGKSIISQKIINEIQTSLNINSWYQKELLFLAGSTQAAHSLEQLGLTVYRVFDDAPTTIHNEANFRMKHWMIFWMLQKFGEVLWIDWDTINLKKPDESFQSFCKAYNTPKFVLIPGYHATVNCSVYYVSYHWEEAMQRSFKSLTSEPNDELLWKSVLPTNIIEQHEFWWQDHVINIWLRDECSWIRKNTYFAHVKTFEYLSSINTLRKERHSQLIDSK